MWILQNGNQLLFGKELPLRALQNSVVEILSGSVDDFQREP